MLEKNHADTLTSKWEPILEGIDDQNVRESTAILLENQARHLLNEQMKETGVLSEAGSTTNAQTTVGSIGTFQKFAFPLVRRVFPELIANKIVGVQPMQGPVSQIFYLGYDRATDSRRQAIYSKYNLTYGQRDIGEASGQWGNNSGASGALDTIGTSSVGGDLLPSVSATFSGGLTDASSTVGGKIAAFPNANTITGYNTSAGELLGQSDMEAATAAGTGASSLVSSISRAYTTGAIPEINFHIQQQPVSARTRKFRALWTLEAAQDLRAYHNLDLERELTDLLGKEIALEIDRELIEDVRGIAYDISGNQGGWARSMMDPPNSNNFQGLGNGVDTWNPSAFTYDQPAIYPSSGTNPAGQGRNVFFVDFASTAMNLSPRHIGQAYANLLAVINFASQDIYKSTYRGAGNFIVTSPYVAAIINSASKLEGGVKAGNFDGQLGANINYAGSLMGQYDVYVDPLYPDDELLMGYKGSSPMDAGFVYSPYIPVQMLPTITDPETFQPRKGLLTRYGKAVITPESRWYRVIRLIGANDYMFAPFARITNSGGYLA